MTPEEAEELLRLVGANRIKRSMTGEYLHFRCPFAPYKDEHASTTDRKPSGWLSLRGRHALFGCWTCTSTAMRFVEVIERLNAAAGGAYAEAVRRARKHRKSAGQTNRRQLYLPIDVTDDYDQYTKTDWLPIDFLKTKGVTKQTTIRDFKLGADTKQGLLLFPIINHEQVVVGAIARPVINDGAERGKYFSFYPRTSKQYHLFGEHLLDFQVKELPNGQRLKRFAGKALIVFEGPLDCMHAYDVGLRNVVALMGAKVSRPQMKMLAAYARTAKDKPRKTIYFILDPDAAGRAGAKRSVNELFLDLNPDLDVRICTATKDPKELSLTEFIAVLNEKENQWRSRNLKERLQQLLQAGKRKTR